MSDNTRKHFRTLFALGLLLSFVSLFLEWYIYQVYDSHHSLKSYWSYNPITGWSTVFSESSTVNNTLKPHTFNIPITLTILYIIMLAVSAYTVIFRDVEQHEKLEKLTINSYANIFLLMLMLYYIFAFPVFYLIPNDLYFPFLHVKDKEANMIYQYSIGPGYYVQIFGFICVFPYALFYYYTVNGFRSQEHSAKNAVKQYVKDVQDPVDMDKLIANEQLKLKFGDKSFDVLEELEGYHPQPIKRRAGS